MNSGLTQWESEERRKLWRRIIRWCLGIPLLLFSYPHLGLSGPFLMLLGVLLIAPDITAYLSGFAGNILWSHCEGESKPLYGIPESLVAKGKYAEAEQEYEKIVQKFPAEVKPHIDMINIAVTRLDDGELAKKLYQRGMSILQDSASQETLTRMYEAISTRLHTHLGSASERKICLRALGASTIRGA